MVAPSTLLVLIITYLQVNVIINADGLTLPLQTVTTKCESTIARPQKSNQEHTSLTPDLTCAPLISLDSCVRPSVNPIGNFLGVNSQEELYQASILPYDASITSNFGPDVILNVKNSIPLSDSAINPLICNSMACGLRLPVAVSSIVTTLPPASLKPLEFTNSCNGAIPNTNVILEDGIQVPTAMNPLAMSNKIPALNNNPTPCNSNAYATGFKSSLSVASASNFDGRNINFIPANPQAPILFDVVPQSQNQNFLGHPEIPVAITPNNIKSQASSFNNLGSVAFNLPVDKFTGLSPLGLDNPSVTSGLISAASKFIPQLKCPCIFEAFNTVNKQDIPNISSGSLIPQKCDMTCPLSISSQSHYVPTSVPYNMNNIPPLPSYLAQMPLSPDLSLVGSPLMPQIGGSIPSQLNLQNDPNYYIAEENPGPCNTFPSSVDPSSPLNKYFKDVRAATSKLKDFMSSFSSKFGSNNIPQIQSLAALSQTSLLQSYCMPLEENFEPSPPCLRPVSPSIQLQQNIIPFDELVSSQVPTIVETQSCNCALSAPQLIPVTFKAPIVPKTIVNAFNFPILTTPVPCNNFPDSLASLSSSNYSPNPFIKFLTIPSNPFSNVGSCTNLIDGPLSSGEIEMELSPALPAVSSLRPKSLPSVLKRPTLGTSLPTPTIDTFEDLSTMLLKYFPHLSSILVNTPLNCDEINDSCEASSNLNECAFDSIASSLLSSPIAQFLSLEPTLDESQLDLCCKNLENIISILESSMNFNEEVDCDFDSFSDILSSL